MRHRLSRPWCRSICQIDEKARDSTQHKNNDPQQAENVAQASRLLNLAADLKAGHFIAFGSQAEYGPSQGALSEAAPTHPKTLYGAAKLASCILLERLAELRGISFTWLRLFSCYGPGDNPRWMLPYLIRRLLKGEEPELTEGGQLWDYLYVSDAGAAALAVLEKRAYGIFNLGSGKARPLREIVEMARDLIDPKLPLGFGKIPYSPQQVMHLEADISRLRAASGWEPKVALAEGLARTIEAIKQGPLD